MKLNGTIEVETKIRRKDGSETVETEEFRIIDGEKQDGDIRGHRA
jgi:hypothetical protein